MWINFEINEFWLWLIASYFLGILTIILLAFVSYKRSDKEEEGE
ncbi:MAG: hypothetical protein QHH15_00340 [Candidatus Thermoplasmatota archaeon]|nr:hypothetical protein [Candidatus Thermoplasmatota archaeon]